MLDFAVNVRAAGPPSWLLAGVAARLGELVAPSFTEPATELVRKHRDTENIAGREALVEATTVEVGR